MYADAAGTHCFCGPTLRATSQRFKICEWCKFYGGSKVKVDYFNLTDGCKGIDVQRDEMERTQQTLVKQNRLYETGCCIQ